VPKSPLPVTNLDGGVGTRVAVAVGAAMVVGAAAAVAVTGGVVAVGTDVGGCVGGGVEVTTAGPNVEGDSTGDGPTGVGVTVVEPEPFVVFPGWLPK